jgi:hypothetical protein
MQASHTCFPISAIRAEDLSRRVIRSGQSGTERPEKFSMRLNKRTPMQVLTGHNETTPLALMLKDNVPVNAPLDFITEAYEG